MGFRALFICGLALGSCADWSSRPGTVQPPELIEAETTGTIEIPMGREVRADSNAIPPGILVTESIEAREPLNKELLISKLECPPRAEDAGLTGQRRATAILTISGEGIVKEIFLRKRDDYGFAKAATEVFRQLRYEPTGDTLTEIAMLWFDCGVE